MQIAITGAGALRSEPNRFAGRLLPSLFKRLRRRTRAAQARSAFAAMSDHMLRDIGLTRSGIDEAVRAAAEAAERAGLR